MKSLKKNNDKIIDFLSEEFYDLLTSLENHVHSEKNTLMFFSPKATAKQMAIEIFQDRMNRRVQRVDLRSIKSEYIGEMEKNLDKIFSKAEVSDTILLFDEADSLFGKNSINKYGYDEQKYLLKKIEHSQKLLILVVYELENLEALQSSVNVIIRFPYFTTLVRKLFDRFKQNRYVPEKDGKLKPATETKIGLSSYNRSFNRKD